MVPRLVNWVCWLVVAGACPAVWLVVPAAAVAAPSSADLRLAEAKAMEAKAYYSRGLHKEAADAFMEAYALSQKPDMVYNAARALEAGQLLERARALYEMYKTLPGVSEDGKKDASQRIALISQQLAAASRPDPPKTEPAKTEPAKADPAKIDPAKTEPAKTEPAKIDTAKPPPPKIEPAKPEPAKTATKPAPLPAEPTPTSSAHWWWAGGGTLALLVSWSMYSTAIKQANDANNMDFGKPNAQAAYNTAFNQAESGRNGAIFLGVVGAGCGAWAYYKFTTRHAPPAAASASWWVAPAPDGVVFGGAL